MLPGQILPGQMWQLKSVLYVPRNLPVKFHQNLVSKSWDIVDIEFLCMGGGWVVCKVIFVSYPTKVRLSWGFDNINKKELQLVLMKSTILYNLPWKTGIDLIEIPTKRNIALLPLTLKIKTILSKPRYMLYRVIHINIIDLVKKMWFVWLQYW